MSARKPSEDDFHMGIAFMTASFSDHFKAAVLVDPMGNMYVGLEKPPRQVAILEKHMLDPALYLLSSLKCGDQVGNLYLTYTPSYDCSLIIANYAVRRLVYHESEPMDEKSENMFVNSSIELRKHQGNMSWIKDQIFLLRSRDIF